MIRAARKQILLIRNAAAYDFGGAERFPVFLAAELEKAEYRPIVISRSAQLLRYAYQQGVQHRRGWWWSQQNWSGKRALLFPVYAIWQLALFAWYVCLLLRLRPDVVHPQSKDDFIAATFAGRLLGKRVIWTDHADLKYIFANHRVWYKNPVGKLVYAASRLAHVITLVSKSEQRLIAHELGHELDHATVVYNGAFDTASTVRPMPGQPKQLIFTATSRLVTAKGIGELITAFQHLHATHPHTILWLVGDGPEADQFKQEAGSDPSIVFVGHSDEPLRYVAAADLFVHPSYHEGFSLSLVEAAMLGKPIIACAVGGNPEIITNGKNGLLIPAMDSEALATAMERLADSAELRRTYGVAARHTYEQQFRFDTIVQSHFIPLYAKDSKD